MNMDITYSPYIEKVEVDNVASLKDWKRIKGLQGTCKEISRMETAAYVNFFNSIGKCMAISLSGPINWLSAASNINDTLTLKDVKSTNQLVVKKKNNNAILTN